MIVKRKPTEKRVTAKLKLLMRDLFIRNPIPIKVFRDREVFKTCFNFKTIDLDCVVDPA